MSASRVTDLDRADLVNTVAAARRAVCVALGYTRAVHRRDLPAREIRRLIREHLIESLDGLEDLHGLLEGLARQPPGP